MPTGARAGSPPPRATAGAAAPPPIRAACRPMPRDGERAMNGAELVAEILKREGTEFLACYPRNPLIEAAAALDIRPILCRQERVGVGMADGYTRIKRGKRDRKSTRLNSSHLGISYAVFCLKKKNKIKR